jgi:hypothetical protein
MHHTLTCCIVGQHTAELKVKLNFKEILMFKSKKNCFERVTFYSFLALMAFVPAITSAAEQNPAFDKTLQLNGIRFHVTCPNDSSLSTLTIVPAGLTIDNSTISTEIDGTVTGAEVDDLDGNGSPEIYVYVTSAGSGSYGSLVAYSSNNNKSISPIYLPPLEEDVTHSQGYMGHDEFTVMEGHLARRFPIYKKDDSNANPTGGMRQLLYKLVPGEATWLLKIIRSTTF